MTKRPTIADVLARIDELVYWRSQEGEYRLMAVNKGLRRRPSRGPRLRDGLLYAPWMRKGISR